MSSNVDFADATGYEGVNPDHPAASKVRILDAEAGLIERTREKVAIVGYATSSRDLAPFNDPTYDIVGLNQLYRFIPRADIWCDIHEYWEEDNVEGTDHRGWLKDCGIPILMSEPDPELPTAVRFPLDPCVQIGGDYFTSTISFLIAWAIHQGYKEIALYGIDLVVGTEYENQKACAEFWLGIAHGRGMTVRLPPQCALLKHTHRYGYEREPDWGLLKPTDLTKRTAALGRQREELLAKLHAIDGAMHEVAQRDKWMGDPDQRLDWLRDRREETRVGLATVDGAHQESEHWNQLLTIRSRGAFYQVQG